MRADPFELADAHRVLEHPDTPAAYVEWAEFLPLTGAADRTHIGNLLEWSHRASRSPLGASRREFGRALRLGNEYLLDAWMESLAAAPIEDFIDHYVPFLRNVATLDAPVAAGWIEAFLHARGHHNGTPAQRESRRTVPLTPHSVILEITQSCNFECTMCSSRTGGFRPDRTMSLPVFGELVRLFSEGARSLRINGYGESTLVPDLHRYIDCLDEFGFTGLREIITNLSGPTEVYEQLVARGFVILASWDAARADIFEQIRVGAKFSECEDRLRRIGSLLSREPERLGLLCTVQEANLDQLSRVVEIAAFAGAGLVILNMVKESDGSPWMRQRFDEILSEFQRADSMAKSLGVTLRIPDHVADRPVRLKEVSRSSATYCDRPWRELLVRWDTEATVCNMFHPWTYGLLVPPGPPRDTPKRFARLWSGANAAAIRSHINREAAHPYCRDCYFLYA